MSPEELKLKLIGEGKFLLRDITFDVIHQLIDWILSNRSEQKEFTLLINSQGGSPGSVLYFSSVAAMLSNEVKLTGVAFGECGSAALALFQCCHERIAVMNCGFFIHHIQQTVEVSSHSNLNKIKKEMEESRVLEEGLVELQCRRTGMSRKKWMKLADRGDDSHWPILPPQALELGLVDKVVDHYEAF